MKNLIPPTLALLTDFGQTDGFAGILKGVILQTLAQLDSIQVPTIVDISHDIPAHTLSAGAWVLKQSAPYFPPNTLFCCIVDPHVGNPAQAKLLAYDHHQQHLYLGPDNGLFGPEKSQPQKSQTERTWYHLRPDSSFLQHPLSHTFYGRDLYAPLSAHLLYALMQTHRPSKSSPLSQLIQAHFQAVSADACQPNCLSRTNTQPDQLIHCDHFGNLITQTPNDHYPVSSGQALPYTLSLQIASQTEHYPIWLVHSYDTPIPESESNPFILKLVPASHGYLEIACYQASAAAHLNVYLAKQPAYYTLSPREKR